MNDCGSRDIWPVAAKILTWGFGPSGSFGFGTPGVKDRFHEFAHSDYFTADFVRKFWRPWIHEEVIEKSDYDSERATISCLRSVVAMLPLQWFGLAAVLFLIWRWIGSL